MKPYWKEHKVNIPEGEAGEWAVTKFKVSKSEASFQNARASFAFSCGGQNIEPGTYTMLQHGKTTVMSDTPSEIRDHMDPIYAAKGDVLIVGLGIGMVTAACLNKPEVDHVTVIEMAPEVIHLVGDHLKGIYGDRLDIVESDIFEWKPPKGCKWDVAWFDIWNHICVDNLDGMATLHRRFGKRAAWKGSWKRDDLLARRRQDKRNGW